MKRAFIFLAAAPAAVALVAAVNVAVAGAPSGLAAFLAASFFCFTMTVAVLAAIIDGALALDLPISLRAPLTAIVGALAASALAFYLFHCLFPPSMLSLFGLGGAVCMGTCSLLSHDYSSRRGTVVASAI